MLNKDPPAMATALLKPAGTFVNPKLKMFGPQATTSPLFLNARLEYVPLAIVTTLFKPGGTFVSPGKVFTPQATTVPLFFKARL